MCDENELANRAIKFAECLLSNNMSYHDHKETMAHACVVLEIAIFGWIMSNGGWAIATSVRFIWFFLVSIVVWLLLHVYIRWELRLRRLSAFFGHGIRKVMIKWTSTNPTMEELQPYEESNKNNAKGPCLFWIILDLIVPCFCGSLPLEHAPIGYPTALVEAFKKAEVDGDECLYLGEWLPSVFSLLIISVVVLRRWTDC